MASTPSSAAELEAQLQPEIDRLQAKADGLAAAVQARYSAALAAETEGDEAGATELFDEVERLRKQVERVTRAWLKLVVQIINAKMEEGRL